MTSLNPKVLCPNTWMSSQGLSQAPFPIQDLYCSPFHLSHNPPSTQLWFPLSTTLPPTQFVVSPISPSHNPHTNLDFWFLPSHNLLLNPVCGFPLLVTPSCNQHSLWFFPLSITLPPTCWWFPPSHYPTINLVCKLLHHVISLP